MEFLNPMPIESPSNVNITGIITDAPSAITYAKTDSIACMITCPL
jgi:hypothetical protein